MPGKEKLDIDERLTVLRIYKEPYRTANRKTLIRRLKGGCVRKKRRRQRGGLPAAPVYRQVEAGAVERRLMTPWVI